MLMGNFVTRAFGSKAVTRARSVLPSQQIAAVWVRSRVRGHIVSQLPVCRSALRCMSPFMAVRPEGANHQWRRIPPRELSIDLEADERLGRVTGWAGAS